MMMTTVSADTTSNLQMDIPTEKRYIYFNPNFCINNINVKDLVARAGVTPIIIPNVNAPPPSLPDNYTVFRIPQVPERRTVRSDYTVYEINAGNLGAINAGNSSAAGPSQPTDYNFDEFQSIWDPSHPWYPRNLKYAENLLNLAADYVLHPNQAPRCRLPPLAKDELAHRMDTIFRGGHLRNALRLESQREKFVKYLRLLHDQIQFDSLNIDCRTQSYAECREKRRKMLKLKVNQFRLVNENAVHELYNREQSIQNQNRNHMTNMLRDENVDTSKLTPYQRRLIFKQKVLAKGKHRFVKFDSKFKVNRTETVELADTPPPLVPINKYKAVSSTQSAQTHTARRSTMRYLRSKDPVHQDCRFYLKSGKCKFGTRCIRKHDPSKLPTALKKKFARAQPKSSFSVNNLARNPFASSSRAPQQPVPRQAVPKPAAKSTKTRRSSDFRFVKETALGPKNVAIHKKMVNKALKWKKRTAEQKQQDCLFYIRRGDCHFGDKCRKKHDPSKVSLCTKFVFTGRCNSSDCLYQHMLIRDKMPLCLFFYAGKCNKETCPFLHIRMGTDVPVCEKFKKGHCERGAACTKRHTRDCEVYFDTGLCADITCKLLHEKQLRNRTISFDSIDNVIDQDRPYYDGDDFIPVFGRVEEEYSQDILKLMDSDIESVTD